MGIIGASQTKCTCPKTGRYKKQYQLKLFEEQNASDMKHKVEFENHLTECQACVDGINWWNMLLETTRENPQLLSESQGAVVGPGWMAKSWGWSGQGIMALTRSNAAMLAATMIMMVLLVPLYLLNNGPSGYKRLAVLEDPTILARPYGEMTVVEQADERVKKGDYKNAETLLQTEIARNPEDISAQLLLAYCYLKQDKNQAGIELLNKTLAVAYAPLDDKTRWLLANAYLIDGQLEQARTLFEKVAQSKREHYQQAQVVLKKLPKKK